MARVIPRAGADAETRRKPPVEAGNKVRQALSETDSDIRSERVPGKMTAGTTGGLQYRAAAPHAHADMSQTS